MKWVRATPASVVDYCFRLLSYYWWINLLEIDWNCNLSPMTFLINLPIMLSKTMDQKALEESYDLLLGLGIIIDVETCNGQWPSSIQVLAILISFLRHTISLTYLLRCLYYNLFSSGVDELLHFAIALVSSSSKNSPYFRTCLLGISSSKSKSTW